MNFIFLLLILFKICTNELFMNKTEKMKIALNEYLNDTFQNYKNINITIYDKCFNELFQKKNQYLENFLFSLTHSGKDFFDLGDEYSCDEQGFSYFLFSYDYDFKKKLDKTLEIKIFEFFEKKNFFTAVCLPDQCGDLLNNLFFNYTYKIENIKINKINEKEENNIIFFVLFIITMTIFGFEVLVSGIFFFGKNKFNQGKRLNSKIYEGNDYDDDDETDLEFSEKIIYNNPNFSTEKRESCSEKIIKFLYKYCSFSTNILILCFRKSLFYNNKNFVTIYKIKVFCLILITFSANMDVYIQLPSRGFFGRFFFNQIYFFFNKFSSFGLNMYICLEGFEAVFKFMSFYKKNFFDTGKKSLTWKGIIKFYFFSLYKIIGFLIIFFTIDFFQKDFIYIHHGGTLYTYFAENINIENILKVFNPKYYSIFSYFFEKNSEYDDFLFKAKMPLIFINEFICFLFVILLFSLGIKFKSKIYDLFLIFILFTSYGISYVCDIIDNKENNELYNYNKIIQNISLIKYPHIFFNNYLLGAFSGLICFYIKDYSINNNSMINDFENCPFKIIIYTIEFFEYLNLKGRKFAITLSFIIQSLICLVYTIIINIKNENNERNNYIVSLEFNTPIKVIFFYESGIFLLCFCFNVILLFSKNLENKNNNNNYSILNLLFQINFSFANTVYVMTYTFYNYFIIQFELTYQNLWLSTFGFYILYCIENIIITMIFLMPLKIIFKKVIEILFVLNESNPIQDFRYKSYNVSGNETLLNQFNPNIQEEDLDN